METTVNRRAFLKNAAAAGGTVALGSLFAASAFAEEAPADAEGAPEGEAAEGEGGPGEGGGMPSMGGGTGVSGEWRTAPDPVPDDQIVEEKTAEFIVVGAGHAGTNCARTLLERGRSVILIEKQDEETMSMLGNDIGHINSDMNRSFGVPDADPIEFYNNWMNVSGNQANPTLVMQFAQRGGEAVDAFANVYDDEQKKNFSIYFWDGEPFPNALDEIGGQKFWYGCLNLRGKNCNMNMTEAYEIQRAYIVDKGGQIDYATDAQQLVQDEDGCVTGVIATNADGAYVKYNATCAVALCAGDFSGHETMRDELLPALKGVCIECNGEGLGGMGGRTGRGLQLGYWAGGRIEAGPIATLGGDYVNPSGICANDGIPIWLDTNGKRYCNEFFGGPEIAGRPGARDAHTTKYCVYDGNVLEHLTYGLPCHTSFDYSDEDSRNTVTETLAAALDAGAEGANGVYCSDDLATLAGYLGLEGEAAENFVASVERYNQLCEQGRDDDFGRDPRVLWKLEPPYYAQATNMFMIGMMMVSLGGLCTDGNSNVLDETYQPIPGLYAAGNNCGRRFGPAYFTPIAGVSIGFAITQGYVLGDYLAANL
jgi:succinate dehydrogenase/fumarate reductase flavoprotein subunit